MDFFVCEQGLPALERIHYRFITPFGFSDAEQGYFSLATSSDRGAQPDGTVSLLRTIATNKKFHN